MKKYEFTGETRNAGPLGDITVKRIRAVITFGGVKAGDLGGWIEKDENLSQDSDAWVYGNAEVYGNAMIYGDARICDNARILHRSHLLVIGPIGSRNDFTTFFRDKDNEITVKCGCFNGKIDRFLEKVQKTHGENKYALIYRSAVEIARMQID